MFDALRRKMVSWLGGVDASEATDAIDRVRATDAAAFRQLVAESDYQDAAGAAALGQLRRLNLRRKARRAAADSAAFHQMAQRDLMVKLGTCKVLSLRLCRGARRDGQPFKALLHLDQHVQAIGVSSDTQKVKKFRGVKGHRGGTPYWFDTGHRKIIRLTRGESDVLVGLLWPILRHQISMAMLRRGTKENGWFRVYVPEGFWHEACQGGYRMYDAVTTWFDEEDLRIPIVLPPIADQDDMSAMPF